MKEMMMADGFSARLDQACRVHPEAPEMNHGRLAWLQTQMKDKYQVSVSLESVSRYFRGSNHPRDKRLYALAGVLNVDPRWLAVGDERDAGAKERERRIVMADGYTSILAGLIAIAGGSPAEPMPSRPGKTRIDLVAIIQRAHYNLHIAPGLRGASGWRFQLPVDDDGVYVVGAVMLDGPCVAFVNLSSDEVRARGSQRGRVIDLDVSDADLKALRISDFSERL